MEAVEILKNVRYSDSVGVLGDIETETIWGPGIDIDRETYMEKVSSLPNGTQIEVLRMMNNGRRKRILLVLGVRPLSERTLRDMARDLA